MHRFLIYILLGLIFFSIVNCKEKNSDKNFLKKTNHIFKKKSSALTNVNFTNKLSENDTLNYFTYPYIYMGGGVSIGDINNDGLDDIFFTGNMVDNELYLNKGNLEFENISEKSGLKGDSRWYTGSTMADVNGDGFLDIYVSVAGQSKKTSDKKNQLFINNGDLTFSERGKEFKLDDSGQSVNATFFDYDNDGDLDVYVANYPVTPFQATTFQYVQLMNYVSDSTSDHLYRNDGNRFTKVTKEAGVEQYNLSLSVTAADFNNDGWQDLYVSSDFNSPDSFYLNKRDGTFENIIDKTVEHTSFYGMGVDIADFNNDLRLDIFQMDMDAASNRRSKANMASMNPKLFEDIKKAKFKTQFMQNSLQLQTAFSKEGLPTFSEISRLAGVSSTDWSWGPLFADFNNDGFKDIFVSNGTRREINNKDYFNSINKEKKHKDSLLIKTLKIPSEPIENFVFENKKDLTFKKSNNDWGITEKEFSNGCAYSDLDNDGDLDLIVNNIDSKSSIYENILEKYNYIQLKFKGAGKNTFGLGVKAYVFTGDIHQFQELTLTRGFQSSVPPKLHFGIGDGVKLIDSIKVVWPNLEVSVLRDVKSNQIIDIKEHEITSKTIDKIEIVNKEHHLFNSYCDTLALYKHKENQFDDFKNEILLPHKTSNFGPGVSVGDLNGDTIDDIYVGAASSYPAGMFFQNEEGGFTQQKTNILLKDLNYEDLDSVIFDADNDGDNDIYVVSGGNEFSYTSKMLQDRLYVNDGIGNFKKSDTALPKMLASGSRVYKEDIDNDGDLDLFVGGRLVPGNYPYPANSYVLENISEKGNPKFIDITKEKAPFLEKIGLVTSASFTDINNDGWKDLIVVGEWMPIKVYINIQGKKFSDVTKEYGLDDSRGWWFSIKSGDFDKDGDQDFIVGNLGLNYKYKAKQNETFDIYFNDFDNNKRNDIVLSYYNEGEKYPVRGRECSSQQIPGIKKKFGNYETFSNATLEEIYGKKLEKSLHYQVKSFASIYLENRKDKFIIHQLPIEAQIAPINQILVEDFNKDGDLDALIAGNLYASEVETPRADAGTGVLLKGDSKGNFEVLNAFESGLVINGDVKDLEKIRVKNKDYIIAAKNNDYMQFCEIVN